MGEIEKVRHHAFAIGPGLVLGRKPGKGVADIPLHQGFEQSEHLRAVGEAEHGPDRVFADSRTFAFTGQRLIEDRQAVTDRTVGGPGNQPDGAVIDAGPLGFGDGGEMAGKLVLGDPAQIEPLAAGQHRERDLAGLGGGEHEFDVLGRLFQGLEQGVEGTGGQHMDFVDDVDLEAGAGGAVAHPFDEFAHVVDAGAAGGIHFQNIGVVPVGDGDAVGANAAGRRCRTALTIGPDTIERPGDDPCGGGLADPAYTGEQPGMGQPVGRDGVDQGPHHGVLADQFGKGLGPVFAGQHLIGGTACARRIACAGALAGRFFAVLVHALDPATGAGKHLG